MEMWAFCFRNRNIMSTVPGNLQNALNNYKANYSAYKVHGIESYKTAYLGAQAIVATILREASAVTDNNDKYLKTFTDSYATTNKDITDLHDKSQQIKKEGPAIQDKLAQSKQLHQHQIAAVNDTGLYIKAGIVVALVVIVGIVGAL